MKDCMKLPTATRKIITLPGTATSSASNGLERLRQFGNSLVDTRTVDASHTKRAHRRGCGR